MKTPEEIKRGLEGCGGLDGDCENCPYDEQTIYCNDRLMRDALAYIQQLESDNDAKQKRIEELEPRLAQVERERDAAVRAISDAQHYIKNLGAVQYGLQQLEHWDYGLKRRGVCPGENT